MIRADWYREQVSNLLSDARTYARVASIPTQYVADSTNKLIVQHASHFTKQERAFMLESVHSFKVPQFHAIPKIHKTPWALRPIVPSHSWITSNMAKVVSYYLKPTLADYPWIVQSTTEVTDRISKTVIPPGGKLFLCTGDVKAMYTNIPLAVAKAATAYCLRGRLDLEPEKQQSLVDFMACCNRFNYFEFDDQTYLQEQGLAMGISCSPDIANLVAAAEEETFVSAKAIKHNAARYGVTVIMYVRYIDDIFMIVKGESEQQVRDFLIATRPLGKDLEVTWSVSDERQVFLDVEVFFYPGELTPRWKPYGKALNLNQRIPWLSAHPKTVKKATFCAKLARLARNSSHLEYYSEAVQRFRDILLARGYPISILRSWIKEQFDQRWAQRSMQRSDKEPAPPMVIKTPYDLIWENVHMDQVRLAMLDEVVEKGEVQSWIGNRLMSRLVLAQSRTTNMFDVTNSMNRSVLLSLNTTDDASMEGLDDETSSNISILMECD